MLSLGTNGHKIQIRWGTAGTFLTLFVMILLTMLGGMRAWGEGQGRLNAMEDRQTVTERAVESMQQKIEDLATSQAATRSTAEAIQRQQSIDRTNIDNRLDDVLEAIRRRRP